MALYLRVISLITEITNFIAIALREWKKVALEIRGLKNLTTLHRGHIGARIFFDSVSKYLIVRV